MKKIFTLIFTLLLSSTFVAIAQTETEFKLFDVNGKQVGEPIKSVVSLDQNTNTFTITNFMNSGSTISFTFANKLGSANAITFSKSYIDGKYIYIKDNDGKYIKGSSAPGAGETAISFQYVCAYDGYGWEDDAWWGTYVYSFNGEDEGWYDLSFYVLGGTDADWTDSTDWYTLYGQEYFKPAGSVVDGIECVEDAPVQYFNINGQRVQNPSNGIFIRKQGDKVNKIVIR